MVSTEVWSSAARHEGVSVVCVCPMTTPFRFRSSDVQFDRSPRARGDAHLKSRRRANTTRGGSHSVTRYPVPHPTTTPPPSPYQHPQPPHQHRTTAPSTTPKGLPVHPPAHIHVTPPTRRSAPATCVLRQSRRLHTPPSPNIVFTPLGPRSTLAGLRSHPYYKLYQPI